MNRTFVQERAKEALAQMDRKITQPTYAERLLQQARQERSERERKEAEHQRKIIAWRDAHIPRLFSFVGDEAITLGQGDDLTALITLAGIGEFRVRVLLFEWERGQVTLDIWLEKGILEDDGYDPPRRLSLRSGDPIEACFTKFVSEIVRDVV